MKVEDHVMFTVRHGEWKAGDRLLDLEAGNVAHFLASVSNTVNLKIPEYLTGVMNVAGILSLAEELSKRDFMDAVIALKSPGVSRKLGSLVFEENKKIRKHLVDVARALLVRETLSRKMVIEYPEKPITRITVVFPFPQDHVNFTAKHGSWIVVKRLMIDENTPMADIARLLASINGTVTLKLPTYAGIDVKGIDSWFSGFKKVKKAEIPLVLERYKQFVPSSYAGKEFEEHARIYALRKALEKIGLALDIPAKSLEKYLEKVR